MNFTVDMVRSRWESMNNTKNSMMIMGETIYSLPRATKKLNQAKRLSRDEIIELVDEFEYAVSLLDELLKKLRYMNL